MAGSAKNHQMISATIIKATSHQIVFLLGAGGTGPFAIKSSLL
jgi:hypothetical protein